MSVWTISADLSRMGSFVALVATLGLLVSAVLVLAQAAVAQATGTVLVDESFQDATADPNFEAFGSACLTGAEFRTPAPGLNMVTVRGPGDGIEGYCFLTATTNNFTTTGPWPSTLPGQLQGPLTTMPPGVTPAEAEALLEPSRRTVTVRVTPAPNPQVTVSIDFNDGQGSQQVLSFAAPQPVTETYKFGFAASTGLFTDVHLIRTVRVTTLLPLPALNLVKQRNLDEPLPPILQVGDSIPYQYTVTNGGAATVGVVAGAAGVGDLRRDIHRHQGRGGYRQPGDRHRSDPGWHGRQLGKVQSFGRDQARPGPGPVSVTEPAAKPGPAPGTWPAQHGHRPHDSARGGCDADRQWAVPCWPAWPS